MNYDIKQNKIIIYMREQALKQILKKTEDLQTDIKLIQTRPPASQTMNDSIKYIINTHEPFIMKNKSSKWDNNCDNICIIA